MTLNIWLEPLDVRLGKEASIQLIKNVMDPTGVNVPHPLGELVSDVVSACEHEVAEAVQGIKKAKVRQ